MTDSIAETADRHIIRLQDVPLLTGPDCDPLVTCKDELMAQRRILTVLAVDKVKARPGRGKSSRTASAAFRGSHYV